MRAVIVCMSLMNDAPSMLAVEEFCDEVDIAVSIWCAPPPYNVFVECNRSSPNMKCGSEHVNVATANTIIPARGGKRMTKNESNSWQKMCGRSISLSLPHKTLLYHSWNSLTSPLCLDVKSLYLNWKFRNFFANDRSEKRFFETIQINVCVCLLKKSCGTERDLFSPNYIKSKYKHIVFISSFPLSVCVCRQIDLLPNFR